MGTDSRQPGFPLLYAATVLTAVCVAALALALWMVPVMLGREPGTVRAVILAGVVSWVAALFSLLPVHRLGPRGLMPAVWGYFIGASGRVLLSLVTLVMAVVIAHLPVAPFAVTLVALYLPLLFVEAGLVGRYVWNKGSLPGTGTGSRPGAAGQATEVLA